MTAEYIYRCAVATVKVYGTTDAEKIFSMRGAEIMDKAPSGLSGMIILKDGKLTVYPPEGNLRTVRKISMAHMLGHLVLHREKLYRGFCFEDALFMKKDCHVEKEADIFASEILISDEKIKELEGYGFTEGQIASHLGLLRPLAGCKIYSMRCRGIPVCGTAYREDFNKRYDIEVIM
ncbi:MAG: ImmA/IrrE family metallo-endopeptidase [Ruminococcaceae bacterium]|nr:ImmA/IrrE family metallo-endopeptidase [Oscillospiraceae bacterium]